MIILFCDSVIDPKSVEPDYESEFEAAKAAGFQTALLSFEALQEADLKVALRYVQIQAQPTIAIFRGWMLAPKTYSHFYSALLEKNIQLLQSPAEYQHCHYLPESFAQISQQSPKSAWLKCDASVSDAALIELGKVFGDAPIIVKDFVKSEKHDWETACFIPKASDHSKLLQIVRRFLELRGNGLNEGIVFRAYENLRFLSQHSKSGMPLTKEFRVFFCKQQLLQAFPYWDEGDYGNDFPDLAPFQAIAKRIASNFFTMDIAQKENGEWIVMELGDGQVSGLPDNANPFDFYKRLFTVLKG